MTAPLCAMWHGHCGNPARLVIEATKRINGHDMPITWFCCTSLTCILDSQSHAAEHGVMHVDSRLITPADLAAFTAEAVAA